MDIVFVRHALAEERNPALRDEERQLLPKGAERTREALEHLKSKLPKGREVVILTSHALRASQTARLMALGLDHPDIITLNAIYDGELDLLLYTLSLLPKKAVALVVGHEPLLGIWSKQLCGQRIDYKKSGMAAFKRQQGEPLRLKPLWLYRAKVEGTQEEAPEPAPTAFTVEQFRQIMIHRVLQAQDNRREFLKQPEQPTTVHQFRVALRQCRSLLSFMRPAFKKKQIASILEAMRGISSQLADLRETDVLTNHWRDFLVEQPEFAADEGISQVLAEVRAFQQRDTVDFAAEAEVGQTLKDVLAWVEGWQPRDMDLKDAALKRWNTWSKDIQQGLEQLDVDDLQSTHRLRLKIKKLRYAANSFPILQDVGGLDQDQLKALQDDLGEICDTHVHLDLLRQLLPEGENAHSVPHRKAFVDWLSAMRDHIKEQVLTREKPAG